MVVKDPLAALMKGRTQLLRGHPFFGMKLYKVQYTETEVLPNGKPCRTMATDGHTIYYNPAFTISLTEQELQGVLAHEVMHIYLRHHVRMGDRRHKVWNYATDYQINDILTKSGLTLPKKALLDPKYNDETAEVTYLRLIEENDDKNKGDEKDGGQGQPGGGQPGEGEPGDEQGEQPGGGAGDPGDDDDDDGQWADSMGEVIPAPDMSEEGQAEETRRALNDMAAAASYAKAQGNLPGVVEKLVKLTLYPSVAWEDAMRDLLIDMVPDDMTFEAPDRRFLSGGYALPGDTFDVDGEVVIACDTSGSTHSAIPQFGAEMKAIISEMNLSKVHVIYIDTKVQRHEEYEGGDEFEMRTMGGGGTAFSPLFSYLEEKDIQPNAVIFLTDLECSDFGPEPDYPVIWASIRPEGTHPWGEMVHVDIS